MVSQKGKVALLILLTLGGILPLSIFFTVPAAHGMARFGSYTELERFLLERSSCGYGYNGQGLMYATPGANRLTASFGINALSAQSSSNVNTAPSHSETNNQVAGVDELDSVKTDGQYIYTVTNDTVVIVDAYPVSDARLLSRISVGNQTIDGIFVQKNRLSIVSEAPRTGYYGYGYCGFTTGLMLQTARGGYPMQPEAQNTSISVYDLSNRSTPTLQTRVTVNGTFVGARLINDFEYLVTSSPAKISQSLPQIIVNGRAIEVQATQIYHSDVPDAAFSYTTIVALNMTQENPTPNVETYLLGTSSTIYVSLTNIFLTQPNSDRREETVIHRISIDNSSIKYEATGSVPGYVLNQYSMDENGGYFRIATSAYGFGAGTNVFVLHEDLTIAGRREGLSSGEIFYAARFLGDRAYLVTYRNTDPLFVMDLHDPTNPSVLGALNVTGYSDFLQPYDQTHLIGIGKVGIHWAVKISLFDVTDPTKPAEVATYVVPSYYSDSPALKDPKAVLFDKSNSRLALPVESIDYSYSNASATNTGICSTSSVAYVFDVTSTSLVLRGTISHQTGNTFPDSCRSEYYITRELFIGNVLYTISNAIIKMNNPTDLSDLGTVSLM